MKGISKERWLEVVEMLAQRRPDECSEEWAWLMKNIDLGPDYFLAIYEAIQQGRWRAAESPGAYIRAVARREARRGEEKSIPGDYSEAGSEMQIGGEGEDEEFSREDMLDLLEYRQDSGKPMRDSDGVWRIGHGWGAYYGPPLFQPKRQRPFRPEGRSGKPLRLRRMPQLDPSQQPFIDERPERLPKWKEWAKAAGISEWESKAVEYKLSGTGLRKAMEMQPDERSRRALRAAWVRLERNGLERLKKSFPQVVPKGSGWDTE